MQYIRQGATQVIMFGPFVDKTDGVTLKTDATTITDIDHATTGIFLSKNGATAAIRSQAVTASVADSYGMMQVTLSATDTGTVGTLDVLFAKAATYLPVHKSFQVVDTIVYDALYKDAAIGALTGVALAADQAVNATKWAGTAITATSIPVATAAGAIGGLLTAPTTANVGTADVLRWRGTAVSDPTVEGVPDVNVKTMNDVSTSGVTTIKAVQGLAVDGVITTLSNLPAATTNWLTGAAVHADAVTKIQVGLATPTNITAASGVVLSAAGSAALTESYPTLGGTGTMPQILYAILQHLEEAEIVGATKTVLKRDQSTVAETLTLNDATTPTAITRAT
jgi:hypothetical protein